MIADLLQNVFRLLGDDGGFPVIGVRDPLEDAAPLAAGGPPWVLHIEDDEEFSAAIQRRLESRGVAVVRAFDGVRGYRSAYTHPADVILLDYELPQAQGDYVLRRLKDNPLTRDIPVIVLSGRTERWLTRQLLNLGAEACLSKPVEMEALLAALGRHIEILPAPADPLAV